MDLEIYHLLQALFACMKESRPDAAIFKWIPETIKYFTLTLTDPLFKGPLRGHAIKY